VKIKPKQRRCYGADHTNLIWHTNLHHFHLGESVIAWIDDRSQLCLEAKVLPNKSSVQTAEGLCEILSQYSAPYSIWTDNGTEFEGSFQMILKKRDNHHICSSPYNPQQSRKCERYWRTVEMAPKQADVAALVPEYNQTPHFVLSQIERPRGMGYISPLWKYGMTRGIVGHPA
jgi:IS30 family transposase